MIAPYQLLPPLSPEEYAALRADIRERGVLVPVERDENGAILDGHHRSAIAAELGIEALTVTRAGMTEAQKREHVLKLNLLRRQLGPIAWAAAFRTLAEARGVRLGQGERNDRTSATVAEVAAELGVAPRTARYRLRLADDLAGAPELAQRVDAGTLPANHAVRMKRYTEEKAARDEAAARRKASAMGQPEVTRVGQVETVEEFDIPTHGDIPILTAYELATVDSLRWGFAGVDLDQRAAYTTRPMAWDGDTLLLPTGCG